METQELLLPLIMVGIVVIMLILGLFNRVIAKLGLRNFYRHKGHAIISIAGLLVGTSIICASMVVGDSIEYYIVEETYETLGHIDMVVTGEADAPFRESVFESLKDNAEVGELTDGMAPLYASSVTVRHADNQQFEPSANLIGFHAQEDLDFGRFTLTNGEEIDGNDLGANDTMINRELAETIDAHPGDTLIVSYSQGYMGFGDIETRALDIQYVLEDTGKTQYNPGSGFGFGTYNIFVNLDTAQEMFNEPDMITHIKVSNKGEIEDGHENSEEVKAALEGALDGLEFHATETLSPQPVPGMNGTYYAMLNQPNMDPETLQIFVNGTEIPETYYVYDQLNGTWVPKLNYTFDMMNMTMAIEPAYIFDQENNTVMLFSTLAPGSIVTAEFDYSCITEVSAAKQRGLDTARAFNDLISTFLTIFGSFAIIAGVILIINIFTMLAEERKSELGMARAVGMKRKHLMQSFLYEGLAYGAVASALGTLLGVGVGLALIWMVNNFINIGIDFSLPFRFQWFSLISAFSLGFIITFGTIFFTSWKISKLNIIRAIRGIDEPVKEKKGFMLLIAGALLTLASAAIYWQWPDHIIVKVIVPSGMIAGLGMILWRWIGDRLSIGGSSLAVFIYTYYAIHTYFDGSQSDNMDFLFIASGVIIVLSLVLLIMYNSRPVILAITGTFGRVRKWRPTIETAVSYPLTKKFRTGMSVAMFALVIYMIVMLSVFSNMFTIDLEEETLKQGGGYDITADVQIPTYDISNVTYMNPVTGQPENIQSSILENTSYAQVARAFTMDANITDSEGMSFQLGDLELDFLSYSYVYGIDESFHQDREYQFTGMRDDLGSPQEVWDLVTAQESDVVVVSSNMGMFMGAEVGKHLKVTDPYTGNVSREYEIVGVVDQSLLDGIFMSRENLIHDFPAMGTTNSIFMFEVDEDHDVQATARALEADFAALGMNAVVVREIAETTSETLNSMFVLFELYLDMGLVVGVAGLGVITIRSVVERTPEIGILRSLGFKRKNVRNAFLIEILFIATLGVLIGIATGVMVSYEIFNAMISDMGGNIEFTIPWLKIIQVTAIAYIATILCTIIPARNASKISPAEALRYVG